MNENTTCSKLNAIIEHELYYYDNVTENPRIEEILGLAQSFYDKEVAKKSSSDSWANQYAKSEELVTLAKNIKLLKESIDEARGEGEEQPKVLRPGRDADLERGKAFVRTMNGPVEEYLQGLMDARQARRDEHTDSLPPVVSPMSKGR